MERKKVVEDRIALEEEQKDIFDTLRRHSIGVQKGSLTQQLLFADCSFPEVFSISKEKLLSSLNSLATGQTITSEDLPKLNQSEELWWENLKEDLRDVRVETQQVQVQTEEESEGGQKEEKSEETQKDEVVVLLRSPTPARDTRKRASTHVRDIFGSRDDSDPTTSPISNTPQKAKLSSHTSVTVASSPLKSWWKSLQAELEEETTEEKQKEDEEVRQGDQGRGRKSSYGADRMWKMDEEYS